MRKTFLFIGTMTISMSAAYFFNYNNEDPIEIESVYLIKDDVKFCKGALQNGSLITASHCSQKYENFAIKGEEFVRTVSKNEIQISLPYSKDFSLPDVTVSNPSKIKSAICDNEAYTLYGKACKVKRKDSDTFLSSDCVFPQGDSGTVLVNKNNNVCLVYSGYYDIMTKNNNYRIGVFKSLENINEQINSPE